MPYLICQKCGGYYELEDDESPEDFDSCQCGGKLIYTEYLDLKSVPKREKSYSILFVLIILVLIAGTYIAFIMPNFGGFSGTSPTVMGTNSKGVVTKNVLTSDITSNPHKKTIAVITGMHPREISAKEVLPGVLKAYTLTHDVEIVNYQINVTDHPDDFTIGRSNGESLVAQYVIPDIKKSNYSLVIIVHNHQKGYGNGYYIATPTMDAESVALGESVHKILPSFNYYKRNNDAKPEQTSISTVDRPIVATGTPVFVYEIPEWLGNADVISNSNKLIDAVFKVI
jgi:hypothetical protein